jgi:4-hydroxy-tetrahydrodipicolinate synthase
MPSRALAGVIVPIITPVDNDDRVDESALRQHVARLIGSGVHGLFVGGSAGEGPLLTLREWRRMLEIVQDAARGAVPLLGGAMDTSVQRIRERLAILAGAGYEYFVVTPTFYNSLKVPGEHLRLLAACAEAAGPEAIVPYNLPSVVQSEIPVEVLAELAQRGLIRYCKESSGNLDYFRRVLGATAPFGLRVFMGDEAGIAQGLQMGACGIVPVCANYEPRTFVQAYQAALDQDWDALARLQARVMVLRQHLPLAAPNWIAGIKHALASQGIGNGQPVAPLEPLNDAQIRTLDEFLAAQNQ